MIWDRISQTPKIEKNSDQSINQKKIHSPTFAIEQVILSSYNSHKYEIPKRESINTTTSTIEHQLVKESEDRNS